MRFWIGVTDNQWFDVVLHIPGIDEVNFWINFLLLQMTLP